MEIGSARPGGGGGPSSSTDTRETVERAPGKRTLTGKVTATTRTRVIKGLQINLNNCKEAHNKDILIMAANNKNGCKLSHDLVNREARKRGISVLVLSEANEFKTNNKLWTRDKEKRLAMRICDTKLGQCMRSSSFNGFVRMDFRRITIFGCYFPPSLTDEEYNRVL
ncbi:unnamed protein product [Bemisia tabaci]|uniref:Uncharacterized protein n=1 Tax=Bemisia tabaci TaxID=7038 RepID=A0A9P0F1B4_BEMTA|nr:unnamed protein product [Bemisia tabaci]